MAAGGQGSQVAAGALKWAGSQVAVGGQDSQMAAGGQGSWVAVDEQHPSQGLVMVHPPSVGRNLVTF